MTIGIESGLNIAKGVVETVAPVIQLATRTIPKVSALTATAARGVNDMVQQNNDLLKQQMLVSAEMQKVSLTSNIEKSKHDAKMSVISNVRAR